MQRFVRERLVPAEDTVEELDEVPADIVDDMKAMGLFGLSIPEEYGGIGLSMSQRMRAAYEPRPHRARLPLGLSAPTSASARRAS